MGKMRFPTITRSRNITAKLVTMTFLEVMFLKYNTCISSAYLSLRAPGTEGALGLSKVILVKFDS